MAHKLLIVGGVAGGATAAARARRLDESAEIILFERGDNVSFANCGLPYHIGGEIPQRRKLLVQTEAGLRQRFNLDIRTRHEVLGIDRTRRTVRVRDLVKEREYEESYDVLLLSPGAEPIRPLLPGLDDPRVHTLRNLADVDRIKAAVESGVEDALVVGGGFIGLEMAENLRRRGINVTLVELLHQVMPPLDPEMATPVHGALVEHGVQLCLGDALEGVAAKNGRLEAALQSGAAVEADMVLLCVGVRPDTQLARDAGLTLNERGAIVVSEQMQTSDPHIYAVGDAVEVAEPVCGGKTMIPLAGPANRQARIAADHIFGRESHYRGTQGTSVVRVFNLTVASTGLSEKALRKAGVAYRKIYLGPRNHVGYFPGAEKMTIKLLFSPEDGRVLGAQIVGGAGVDKRIDVLAVAIQARMTVMDLEEVELAYAPQYGAAKDPVNLAGFIATNVLKGDVGFIYAEDLGPDPSDRYTIVDLRASRHHLEDPIPGALSIPSLQLRERWREIPRDKPVVLHCYTGHLSYYAYRFLRQQGVSCHNLAGGLTVYRFTYPAPSAAGVAAPPTQCC
jgi:NADPH-dependent 2,4-dienoyl-CoA reductase/sulfur reductase-like enzyme/rhodanese-related sulfurtransferase